MIPIEAAATAETVETNAVTLAHGVDFYRRYPGEAMTVYTRLTVQQPVTGQVVLNVHLPLALATTPEACQGPAGHGRAYLVADSGIVVRRNGRESPQDQVVFWRFDGESLRPGQHYEYKIKATIRRVKQERAFFFKSWAEATSGAAGETASETLGRSETATFQILTKARSLNYLPAIYQDEEHELMWRYLMIFDRVWALYEELLAQQSFYFDAHLAPANFQPWLASWVGLFWDKRLPAPVQDRLFPDLMPKMMVLYQKRGTKQGLQEYLQACLGAPDETANEWVKIEENLAGNFILNDDAEMGDALIMGSTADEVCKFTVTLTWPDPDQALDERLIRAIIEAWKPAHTTYELFIR